VEIKCQLDAAEVFIADLTACLTCFGHYYAHHQELKSIIQWLLPVVFGVVVFKLLVWCGAEGYVSSLQDTVRPFTESDPIRDAAVIQFVLLEMSIVLLETCRGL